MVARLAILEMAEQGPLLMVRGLLVQVAVEAVEAGVIRSAAHQDLAAVAALGFWERVVVAQAAQQKQVETEGLADKLHQAQTGALMVAADVAAVQTGLFLAAQEDLEPFVLFGAQDALSPQQTQAIFEALT